MKRKFDAAPGDGERGQHTREESQPDEEAEQQLELEQTATLMLSHAQAHSAIDLWWSSVNFSLGRCKRGNRDEEEGTEEAVNTEDEDGEDDDDDDDDEEALFIKSFTVGRFPPCSPAPPVNAQPLFSSSFAPPPIHCHNITQREDYIEGSLGLVDDDRRLVLLSEGFSRLHSLLLALSHTSGSGDEKEGQNDGAETPAWDGSFARMVRHSTRLDEPMTLELWQSRAPPRIAPPHTDDDLQRPIGARDERPNGMAATRGAAARDTGTRDGPVALCGRVHVRQGAAWLNAELAAELLEETCVRSVRNAQLRAFLRPSSFRLAQGGGAKGGKREEGGAEEEEGKDSTTPATAAAAEKGGDKDGKGGGGDDEREGDNVGGGVVMNIYHRGGDLEWEALNPEVAARWTDGQLKASVPVEVIGSFSYEFGTFAWAWRTGWSEAATGKIRAVGEAEANNPNAAVFSTTGVLECEEGFCWSLMLLVSKRLRATHKLIYSKITGDESTGNRLFFALPNDVVTGSRSDYATIVLNHHLSDFGQACTKDAAHFDALEAEAKATHMAAVREGRQEANPFFNLAGFASGPVMTS